MRVSTNYVLGVLFCFSICAHASQPSSPLTAWIATEGANAQTYMFRNISPPGTAAGVVIASPSQQNPNYYYHWIRDAALTMNTVVTLYSTATDPTLRAGYSNALLAYVDFSRGNQLTPNPSGQSWNTGLGEPKFNVDGSAFTGNWGRPQNDGPALRVITLARFANFLLNEGQQALVESKLYAASIPANTVVKADLEYISHHWQDPSFDLWEEVLGTHFYTRMVIRKALLDGAALANRMSDPSAAQFYEAQAQSVQNDFIRNWDSTRGYLMEDLDTNGGGKNKVSNLDSGVIVGSLVGCNHDQFLCPSSDEVLATAVHIEQAFRQIYPINQIVADRQGAPLGAAIGRYPEDTYSGTSTQGQGNPWFVLTDAFAELCYRASQEFSASHLIAVSALNLPFFESVLPANSISIKIGDGIVDTDPRFQTLVNAIHDAGDRYLNRVQYHTDAQGSLTEQMNRYTGFMQGAGDLTWSYASFLTASWAR